MPVGKLKGKTRLDSLISWHESKSVSEIIGSTRYRRLWKDLMTSDKACAIRRRRRIVSIRWPPESDNSHLHHCT